MDDEQYSRYLDERKALVQAELEGARGFDKYLITLAAGALALSMTFVHTIAPEPKHGVLLSFSWFLFALALVLMLSSFLASQHAYRRQRDILDALYEADASSKSVKNAAAVIVDFLNVGALILFVLGVLLFAIFCKTNIG